MEEVELAIDAMRSGLIHRPSHPPTDADLACPACSFQAKLQSALPSQPEQGGEPAYDDESCGGTGETYGVVASTPNGDELGDVPCPGCSHPDCPNRQDQKGGEEWPPVVLNGYEAQEHRDDDGRMPAELMGEACRYVPATSSLKAEEERERADQQGESDGE